MKCKDVRWDLIAATGFAPPLFDLPVKAPAVFRSFYAALEQRYPLDLTGMESHGSTTYSEVKLVLNVERGKIRCELSPAVALNQFREMAPEELGNIKQFGRLYEGALKVVFPDLLVSDRVYRLLAWLDVEGEVAAVDKFLEEMGSRALALNGASFKGLRKEFTLRVDLKGENRNLGYVLQRSGIGRGHLYIETVLQFPRVSEDENIEATYDELVRWYGDIKQELGLDG